MERLPRIGVLSLGTYIPKPRMTSEQLAHKSGIPRGVIEDKFGVLQKPMPGPEDHPCLMGARAAQVAIARAGIDPLEIDAVVSISEEYKERPLMVSGHQDPAARRRAQRLGGRRRPALLHDDRRPDPRARAHADRRARSHRAPRRRIPQRRPHRLRQSARVVHVLVGRRRRRHAAAPRSRGATSCSVARSSPTATSPTTSAARGAARSLR